MLLANIVLTANVQRKYKTLLCAKINLFKQCLRKYFLTSTPSPPTLSGTVRREKKVHWLPFIREAETARQLEATKETGRQLGSSNGTKRQLE